MHARGRREAAVSETRDGGNGGLRDRVTDGSLQGGDATEDGCGRSVGVVVVPSRSVVVVGLVPSGQMSRWIWHQSINLNQKWGGGPEARERDRERIERSEWSERSVRRRLIWNGRGRVGLELSNNEWGERVRGPTSVRSAGWSQRSSTAKTGGWACRRTVLGLQLGGGDHSVDGQNRKLSFRGLEICKTAL